MPEIERRICPKQFQDRLTRGVGVNQYGDPLWKIGWGQTETFTAGGYWPHDHFLGYRQLMMSNGAVDGRGDPCWMVMEWLPPERWGERPEGTYTVVENGLPAKRWHKYEPGTPGIFYWENRDEYTGLQTLGEFPYRGKYQVAFKLTSAELRSGRMEVLHYQLDGFILDWLVPMLVAAQKMKFSERMALAQRAKEEDEKVFDGNWEASRRSAKLASGHSTQKVLDRELMMRKQMEGFLRKYGRVRPGMHQGKFQA